MIFSKLKTVFLVAMSSLIFTGCASAPKGILLSETPLNMSASRRVITSIIGHPREISENGRELFSQYYDHRNLDYDPAKSGKERFYNHILILNDRRPYDIEVRVAVEEKQGSQFVLIGYDNLRAKRLADRIKKALNESRDNRNVIDDFKPY